MVDVPRLTTFRGWLRCHRASKNNVWGDSALLLAFPGFNPPEWSEQDVEKAMKSVSPAVKYVRLQPAQHRRFGGYDLKRGAYYSLCSTENGDDSGTLTEELKAYRDRSDQHVVVDAFDGSRFPDDYFDCAPANFRRLKDRCIFISIYPASRLRKAIEPLGDAALGRMSNPAIMSTLTDNRRVWVAILPDDGYHEISDIVDLRDPATRHSFYNVFRTGKPLEHLPESLSKTKPLYSRPLGDNISDFVGMIPELISPCLGGADQAQGGVTQAIGTYLRARGISGLVYPSARNDSYVEIRNGTMTCHGGWSFVDFRDSPLDSLSGNTVTFAPWSARVLDGIKVQAPTAGTFAGSLKIEGLSAVNQSLYDASSAERQKLAEQLNAGPDSVLLVGSANLDVLSAQD